MCLHICLHLSIAIYLPIYTLYIAVFESLIKGLNYIANSLLTNVMETLQMQPGHQDHCCVALINNYHILN